MVELFGFVGSNAVVSAQVALRLAGIEHELRTLPPGLHPALLRMRGFPRATVPALRVDHARIQGSRAIASWAAERAPDCGLLPTDETLRGRVLDAERDGERLQNTIRRLVYIAALEDRGAVRAIVDASYGMLPRPMRALIARALVPAAMQGHRIRAARVDEYLGRLETLLEQFDALVAEGVIGGARPNVADAQIGPNLAALAMDPAIAPVVQSRPCWRSAALTCERYPLPVAATFPASWQLEQRLAPAGA